ncbi:hypothetical protein [Xylella fastidiosa]|uniref:Uncharacterized protein n=2 Tax=Xylella fastidiosa TaxID=2371 RepID=Q9PAW5_XYLFA|nr:hypothetical protein [Xylella fastidiosa]AAF85179.1 hypothetical protein XF_2380 [Xylella fastidiosa 9a5c]ETE34160.1 hypothetical protein B398_03190 [Xylella fastidiosa 32]MDG5823823.1 hypothetical protein [Xylella fastidiosa subsp. pauca]MDG5824906.1 hypothetical protein [Xylella fastidiosa subsp. pauca]WGZ32600.1 hypothetical protein O4444_03000 [Xylella fastidiosa subsp. pauca]
MSSPQRPKQHLGVDSAVLPSKNTTLRNSILVLGMLLYILAKKQWNGIKLSKRCNIWSGVMNTILKQLLTGKDNQTHDLVRWLGTIVVFTALTLTIYSVVWRGQAFEPQAFCFGMSSIFATLGAALKLKETTEPYNYPESNGSNASKATDYQDAHDPMSKT